MLDDMPRQNSTVHSSAHSSRLAPLAVVLHAVDDLLSLVGDDGDDECGMRSNIIYFQKSGEAIKFGKDALCNLGVRRLIAPFSNAISARTEMRPRCDGKPLTAF